MHWTCILVLMESAHLSSSSTFPCCSNGQCKDCMRHDAKAWDSNPEHPFFPNMTSLWHRTSREACTNPQSGACLQAWICLTPFNFETTSKHHHHHSQRRKGKQHLAAMLLKGEEGAQLGLEPLSLSISPVQQLRLFQLLHPPSVGHLAQLCVHVLLHT